MACPITQELRTQDYFSALNDKATKFRIPLSGSIELTERCNLNCKHCYINLPANDCRAQKAELKTEEVFRILDEIAEAGCLLLLLTGGEPLLRPDFLEIYKHAKKTGFMLWIFTNGTMITPQVADCFAQWPPRSIEITLYGMKEATYEAVTGFRGSYKKCIRGIELLHERGLPLKLKTLGLTINKEEVSAVQAYSESLGLSGFKVDYQINPRLNRSDIPCRYRLSPREIVELEMSNPKLYSEWQSLAREGEKVDPEDAKNLYRCGAGLSGFHIDAYGRLCLCIMSRMQSYDLRKGTFLDGFNNFLLEARTKPCPPDFPCNRCQLEHLCDHCPGQSELVYGTPEKLVDFFCELTHRRAAALGSYLENPVLDLGQLTQEKSGADQRFLTHKTEA
jgi:MoaA/NifB/PqqE/SkfB family radical SAM enzyme